MPSIDWHALGVEAAADAGLDGSASLLRSYRDRPLEFMREVLRERYWTMQRYVVDAVYRHRRVTHRSCRKSGKTRSAAGLALHFGSSPSTIITTAPVNKQVRESMWGKGLRPLFTRANPKLPGRMLTTSWRIEPDWYAIGFSTDDPRNFLGFHADIELPEDDAQIDDVGEDPFRETTDGVIHANVEEVVERATFKNGRLLMVLDEAPGIDAMLYEIIEGSLAGDNTYVLEQGNPIIDANSPHPFARHHAEGSEWHRIHTSAFIPDPGEDDVGADKHFHGVPPYVMKKAWARARLKEWGRDSAAFRAHVGGMFGREGMDSSLVVSRAMLESAEAREATSEQGRHLGVDVALEGDECVAALVVDGVVCAVHTWRSPDLMATADLIVTLAKRWDVPAMNVHVDVIGLGAGVVSRLAQMGYRVDGVDFGASAKGDWSHLFGDTKPRNRRAELHWVARRVFEEGLGHVPRRWNEMWTQAMWATFEIRQEGGSGSTLVIEPKEKIRGRYGRSPDWFDAFLLAWSRSGRAPTPRVIRRR